MSIAWNKDGTTLKLPAEVALEYSLVKLIGEGTYGKVFVAEHLRTGHQYAIKVVSLLNKNEGVPPTTMREMALLRDLNHPHIVRLHRIFVGVDSVAFVFELCANDLGHVLDNHIKAESYLPRGYVRSVLYQIVKALEYVHDKNILHRDIKPQNILLCHREETNTSVLPQVVKIADFGLSVKFGLSYLHEQKYCTAITLWYRPPELLLGEIYYNVESEIWSVGCLFLELLLTYNLFNGNNEVQQLRLIFSLLDLPVDRKAAATDAEIFEELGHVFKDVDFGILKFLHSPILHTNTRLKNYLPYMMDPITQDLVLKMLTLDPSKRITTKEILAHPYFNSPQDINPAVAPSKFVQVAHSIVPKFTAKDVSQPIEAHVIYEENLTKLAKQAIARDYS